MLFDEGLYYSMFEGSWDTARHQREIYQFNNTGPEDKNILQEARWDAV